MSQQDAAITSREEFIQGFLNHLTIPFLKPVAEGFFENIRRVESLIHMPLLMFSVMEVDAQFAKQFETLALDYWTRGERITNFLDDIGKAAHTISPKAQPDFIERTLKRRDKLLQVPSCGKALQESMQVLYSASISGSWTALECLATDLWVAALNEEPIILAQAAIASLDGDQEPGELTAKHIPVGLAARYGFDLRGCLGTILKSKFDFTGISGIQKAYKVFVPNDEFILKVLAQPEIRELEATRHVVVHRAGRVDEEYRKRTKSTLPVGEVLTFDEEQSMRICYLSTSVGTALLAFVNDYLVKKKKKEQD